MSKTNSSDNPVELQYRKRTTQEHHLSDFLRALHDYPEIENQIKNVDNHAAQLSFHYRTPRQAGVKTILFCRHSSFSTKTMLWSMCPLGHTTYFNAIGAKNGALEHNEAELRARAQAQAQAQAYARPVAVPGHSRQALQIRQQRSRSTLDRDAVHHQTESSRRAVNPGQAARIQEAANAAAAWVQLAQGDGGMGAPSALRLANYTRGIPSGQLSGPQRPRRQVPSGYVPAFQ